ncbi:peptidylprolyl isomerase [Clostridiaceae bacterium HSG29]|nr:peptidylprolyl isomerase [Clostridiaceae bacterium HSG29]
MKKILVILLIAVLLLSGCAKKEVINEDDLKNKINYENNPKASILLEGEKEIIIELYPEIAKNTVNNFISLAQSEFYNDLIFHRVIKNFMIQGGCPDGTGAGGPGYSINGEFTSNGFENNLLHDKGVISMARTMDPNSAGSQFFIMHEKNESLDEKYAAFGKVIEGMGYVDEIANVETGEKDKPIVDQIIKSITIDLNGYEPEKPTVK